MIMRMRKKLAALAATAALIGGGTTLIGLVGATPAAAAGSNCNLYAKESTIGVGNAGPSVQRAQCEVNWAMQGRSWYHAIAEDGIFGSRTKAAVEDFQACAGTTPDGIVGPITWSWLDTYYIEGEVC
jgi:peptidoglycan hydrolase-like protein with peptidoglycan-binding domain